MRVVPAALVLATVVAAPARAADGDYCVGTTRDGCTAAATVTEALGAPGRLRIFVGAGSFDLGAPLTDGGQPVEIAGAGAARTTIGALELDSGGSRVADLRLSGALSVAGRADRVRADAGVTLIAGPSPTTTAQLAQAVVDGGVLATGPAQLDDVDLTASGAQAAALDADCAPVLARGLTVRGSAPNAVAAACATPGAAATVALHSSVLPGDDPVAPVAAGDASTVTTSYSEHADDPDATATNRLDPGAPLVDAGDPAPLAEFEPFEDAAGDTRITDGDGDGVLRRDVGAYEAQPGAPAVPQGNVLADGGAESADPALGGAPPGWTGTFTTAAYGTPSLLTGRQGAALGGGTAFFTAGTAANAELLQRIDVTTSSRAIDTGSASALLSGLLGGYGNDADRITVSAAFRDPEGMTLGMLQLGPVTPEERLQDSNLLQRSAQGAIPARTRAVDVTIHGERAAGAYTDAYADNLALVLSVPGVPVEPPVQATDPIVAHLRPFSGVSILTAKPVFSRRWRAPVVVACPDASVGRCSAQLELVAKLPRATTRTRIAHFAYASLAPGTARRIMLRLLVAPRQALRGRHALPARLLTVARDTQGVQRTRTVPVRLQLPAARR
jgi:hypothetical protein